MFRIKADQKPYDVKEPHIRASALRGMLQTWIRVQEMNEEDRLRHKPVANSVYMSVSSFKLFTHTEGSSAQKDMTDV